MIWIWWAPLGAVLLHIGEEFVYPGGFPSWDRAYRPSIATSITPRFHVVINALLVFLCFSVAVAGMPGGAIEVGGLRLRSAVPGTVSVFAWLTLAALLVSNTVFHVVGTFATRRVSPGVRTAILLYVPVAVLGFWHFLQTRQVSLAGAVAAAAAGGSYHVWASMLHRWRGRTSR